MKFHSDQAEKILDRGSQPRNKGIQMNEHKQPSPPASSKKIKQTIPESTFGKVFSLMRALEEH
jgi:hypothetical protein